jgi:hypothetical protein
MPVTVPVGKGATSTNVDKTPLYTANFDFINKRLEKYNSGLNDFVTSTFQTTGIKPVVNGKEITDLNQLADHLKNNKTAHDLYMQAVNSLDDPSVDLKAITGLLDKKFTTDLRFGYYVEAKKQMGKDLKKIAVDADEERSKGLEKGKVESIYNLVLSSDGMLLTEKEANKNISSFINKKYAEGMKDFYKNNPKPSITNQSAYTDIPNPLAGRLAGYQIKTSDGQIIPLPNNLSNNKNTYEGWLEAEKAQSTYLRNRYNDLNYNAISNKLVEKYNSSTKVNKLKAKAEGIMDNNAGGALSTISNLKFEFDIDNRKNWNKNSTVGEDLKNVHNFISNVVDFEDAKFLKGNKLVDAASSFRDLASNETSKTIVKNLLKDFEDQLKDVNKNKGTKSRVKGTVEFQPIALGDENLHAYHISINHSYLKEDYNDLTKEEEDILNDGVTIIVPTKNEKIKNINISNRSIQGTKISPVEGMLGLSEDSSVNYNVKDGIQYKIQRNKNEGTYTISGYFLSLDPTTSNFEKQEFRYDTSYFKNIPGTDLPFKLSYNLTNDIDAVNEMLFAEGIKRFYANNLTKRELSKLKGIKDPKALTPK